MMGEFCKDAHDWLQRDPKNIAVVHCKAGKGRTGTMIAALLLHCGYALSATQSLSIYAAERTEDGEVLSLALFFVFCS
jgi:phosphatidylinositol-3,4,5-trisphosphate 3-phosphatase/dual-specificity protein phosphatase PTEN